MLFKLILSKNIMINRTMKKFGFPIKAGAVLQRIKAKKVLLQCIGNLVQLM